MMTYIDLFFGYFVFHGYVPTEAQVERFRDTFPGLNLPDEPAERTMDMSTFRDFYG